MLRLGNISFFAHDLPKQKLKERTVYADPSPQSTITKQRRTHGTAWRCLPDTRMHALPADGISRPCFGVKTFKESLLLSHPPPKPGVFDAQHAKRICGFPDCLSLYGASWFSDDSPTQKAHSHCASVPSCFRHSTNRRDCNLDRGALLGVLWRSDSRTLEGQGLKRSHLNKGQRGKVAIKLKLREALDAQASFAK